MGYVETLFGHQDHVLALDALRARGWGWLAWIVLAGSAAMFAWFFPILDAAPLDGPRAFEHWMWLSSWR